MEMAAIGGALVGILVIAVIGLLLAALILKLSVRMVEGFSPGYGRSLLVVVVAGIIGFAVNMVVSAAMGVGGAALPSMDGSEAAAAAVATMMGAMLGAMAVSLLASLFITAACVNWLIRHPDGRAIGYGRSLLVSLLYLVIATVLGIVIGVVLGLVIGLGAAGMAASMG